MQDLQSKCANLAPCGIYLRAFRGLRGLRALHCVPCIACLALAVARNARHAIHAGCMNLAAHIYRRRTFTRANLFYTSFFSVGKVLRRAQQKPFPWCEARPLLCTAKGCLERVAKGKVRFAQKFLLTKGEVVNPLTEEGALFYFHVDGRRFESYRTQCQQRMCFQPRG